MSELKIYGHEPVETAWGSPTSQREPLLRVTVNWSTRIVEGHRSGLEYRTPLITEPRYEIEGSEFVLTDESYATLSQAFQNTGGRARSFPFKNPIDYYCTADPEALAEDIYQQGFIVPTGDGKGRIVKQFHCHGVNAYKTVLYPIADSLSVEGLTVDEETGEVDGVSGTEWIACNCEYRQRFRFDVSDLQLTQIKRALDEFDVNVYQTVNFRLVEDSYEKLGDLIVADDWGVDIDFDLLLLPHADLTYSDIISTRIERSISQKELREEVTNLKQNIILESGNLNRLNTQIFLTIYSVCKGRLNGINFGEELVRFDDDTLAIEQLGVNAFAINGLPIRAIAPTDTPDGGGIPVCTTGTPYSANLALPLIAVEAPRQTETISFSISEINGDILPITNFVLDDFAFIVPSDHDIMTGYSLVGTNRAITIPSEALIVYEGGNPNYADGALTLNLTTTFTYESQTYTINRNDIDPDSTIPLSEGIVGVIAMGVTAQPHNAISLNFLSDNGYISDGIISFKIMHIAFGGGNIELGINVPAC
jgi:hypothetical protein